jgi:hypothetical protein
MYGKLITIASAIALLTSCSTSENCQSTCQTLYFEGECNIPTPGRTSDQAFDDCVSDCQYAMERVGVMGDYDPNERNTSGQSPTLENEVQAAAWMNCVEATSCELINDGYCAPS